MTMRFIESKDQTTPRARSQELIRRLMERRAMKRQDPLPSYAKLAEQFGVSILTIQRAMDDLARQGVVRRVAGKGTFAARSFDGGERMLQRITLLFAASTRLLIESPYLNEILSGLLIMSGYWRADLNIVSIFSAGGKIDIEAMAWQTDGVILLGLARDDLIEECIRHHIPTVVADYAPSRPLAADFVAVDNAGAVRSVMAHLRKLGHRRIAYIDGSTSEIQAPGSKNETHVPSPDTVERRAAYENCMRRAGLAGSIRIFEAVARHREAPIKEAIRAVRSREERPTAILCYDAETAALLVDRLTKAGIPVPQQVSVAAAAGCAANRLIDGLQLTFNCISFRDMGCAAVQCLRDRHASPRLAKSHVKRIPSHLVAGNTTRRV